VWELARSSSHAPTSRSGTDGGSLVVTKPNEGRASSPALIFRTVNEAIEQKALQMGGLDEYRFIWSGTRS
jgi:hypothetical protein